MRQPIRQNLPEPTIAVIKPIKCRIVRVGRFVDGTVLGRNVRIARLAISVEEAQADPADVRLAAHATHMHTPAIFLYGHPALGAVADVVPAPVLFQSALAAVCVELLPLRATDANVLVYMTRSAGAV